MTVTILIGLHGYHVIEAKTICLHNYNKRFVLANTSTIINKNIPSLFVDYLQNFYFNAYNIYAFSPRGIFELLNLFFALITPGLGIILYRHFDLTKAINHQKHYFLFSSACFLLILVCLSQNTLFKHSSFRYMFDALLAVFLLTAYLSTIYVRKHQNHLYVLPMLLLALLLAVGMPYFDVYDSRAMKAKYLDTNEILNDNGLNYGYVVQCQYKAFEVFSNGQNHTIPVNFDEKTNRFYVGDYHYYLDDLKKPAGMDTFYIIDDAYDAEDAGDKLLADNCKDKIETELVTIYLFDVDAWDLLFQE